MTYPHDTIDVYEAFDGTISLWKKGRSLNFKEIVKNAPKPADKSQADELLDGRTRIPRKPAKNHPWRGNRLKFEVRKTGHF